jgi:hypothetical protein
VSPFDIYAKCPECQSKIKVRSFSATTEIENVFDAVFEWIDRPEALNLVSDRQRTLRADSISATTVKAALAMRPTEGSSRGDMDTRVDC